MSKKVVHLTVKDMMERFQVDKPETIYAWADRHRDILKPMRMDDGKYLFSPADVAKFEKSRRDI